MEEDRGETILTGEVLSEREYQSEILRKKKMQLGLYGDPHFYCRCSTKPLSTGDLWRSFRERYKYRR